MKVERVFVERREQVRRERGRKRGAGGGYEHSKLAYTGDSTMKSSIFTLKY